MSTSTPYDQFQTIRNALDRYRGPWRVEGSTADLYCSGPTSFAAHGIACRPYGCLSCYPEPTSASLSFNVKHIANISFPMSQFGNVDILDFTLRYNYYWSSDETSPGVTQALRVTIGSWSDLLYFSSGNHTEWHDADQPLGEPFNQVGTTSVSRSPDGTTGYIPITIDFSFTRKSAAGLARLFLIGRTFGLHPSVLSGNSLPSRPPSEAFASAGAATPSPASSSIPSSFGTNSQSIPVSLSGIPLPGYTVGQLFPSSIAGDPSVGSSSSNGGNRSIQHVSKAGVVGGILGGVAALVISSLLLFALYRKKKNQSLKGEERSASVWVGGLLDPTTIAGGKSGDESGNDGQPRIACEKPGLPGFHRSSARPEK